MKWTLDTAPKFHREVLTTGKNHAQSLIQKLKLRNEIDKIKTMSCQGHYLSNYCISQSLKRVIEICNQSLESDCISINPNPYLNLRFLYVYCMHLQAKANSLSVQTFMANKSLSDSDSRHPTLWEGTSG